MLFQSRRLQYHRREVVILLQDANGPCPLIALVNALSLRGSISLPYSSQPTPALVVEEILRVFLNNQQRSLFPNDKNFQFAIDSALAVLPSLRDGLDVNPGFSGVDVFEPTAEISVFDACRIRLFHGMVIDRTETELLAEVGSNLYNAMVAKQACEPESAVCFAAWTAQFPSQMSFAGLTELGHTVREGEIAILFRNNHFSVITKVGGVLHQLVTDFGVATAHPTLPWMSLVDISGESSVYRNASFRDSSAPCVSSSSPGGGCVGCSPGAPSTSSSSSGAVPLEIPLARVVLMNSVEHEEDPPTPPRRNSQLVRRETITGDREVVMLHGKDEQEQSATVVRRRSSVGESSTTLAPQYSQASVGSPDELTAASGKSEPPKGGKSSRQDACCSVM